jgi:hypothetical protein
MNRTNDKSQYCAGDVVYFHHLHRDVPVDVIHENEDGTYRVEVEGKPRRMLIFGRPFRVHIETIKDTNKHKAPPSNVGLCEADQIHIYEAMARRGYLVASLRSFPGPSDREKFIPLGPGFLRGKGPADVEKETWLSRELYVCDVENVCQLSSQLVEKISERVMLGLKERLAFERMGCKWT